ncbi:hypothetical protein [Brevibacillus fortis]|uniref:hypothetical protein n=1 Tax=Brevibacillus fortis TaxID=2126352 RepID=UPI0038FBFADC
MKSKTAGLLLLGFTMLTTVIAYGFDQLTNAIKESAVFVRGGGSIGTSEPSVPEFTWIFLGISLFISWYMMSMKD